VSEETAVRVPAHGRITAASRPERVRFYEDRAEVGRVAAVTLDPGVHWVRVTGITPVVDDRSLGVGVDGGAAQVVTAAVGRRVIDAAEAGRAEVEAAEAALDEARAALAAAERAAHRATARSLRVGTLGSRWVEAAAQVGRLQGAFQLDPWRQSIAELVEEDLAAAAAIVEADHRVADASEAVARAQARLDAARQRQPVVEAHVDVQLEVQRPGEVRLAVTYRTPCALWRPEHLARLRTDDEGTTTVEVTTWATAWQATGEHWEGVEAFFETARPAAAASPPVLIDDVLTSRPKDRDERRTVVVEEREEQIAVAGPAGTRRVQDMPGIDDAGVPLQYAASEPVTLPSDGEPHRVEVQRRQFPAAVALTLVPEVDAAAHVRATGTLPAGGPLLAGPVQLARGDSVVGRGRLGFVAAGEPFELGFGVDDGVRVRRLPREQRDTATMTGTVTIQREVRVFVTNLSDRPRTVEVRERVPVSELDAVRVEVASGGGFGPPDQDGFVTAPIELRPGGQQELTLRYTMRARSNVVLPF
jgi:uncharacterized protein (TIGR02231 family)